MNIENGLLELYRGEEITRCEIEDRTNRTIPFVTLLGQLHIHDLPLPPQKRGSGLEL